MCGGIVNIQIKKGLLLSLSVIFFKSANILQSCLPPAPELQQASCTSLLLTVDGTDGRTPYRYTDAYR